MTNLCYTADHHAVLPLNIRPVESGIIPDHFSTGWKTDPAHHDLSERAWPTPLYFRPTYALSDQGPLIADPSIFPERERAGLIGSLVWTGLTEVKQAKNICLRRESYMYELPFAWHDGEQHLRFQHGLTSFDREGRSAAHFPLRKTWRFQLPYHNFSVLE